MGCTVSTSESVSKERTAASRARPGGTSYTTQVTPSTVTGQAVTSRKPWRAARSWLFCRLQLELA